MPAGAFRSSFLPVPAFHHPTGHQEAFPKHWQPPQVLLNISQQCPAPGPHTLGPLSSTVSGGHSAGLSVLPGLSVSPIYPHVSSYYLQAAFRIACTKPAVKIHAAQCKSCLPPGKTTGGRHERPGRPREKSKSVDTLVSSNIFL